MDTSSGVEFNAHETPCPSTATYDAIVEASCEAKDLDSAHSWYQQLARNGCALQQPRYWALGYAPRASSLLFLMLMNALALDGRVEEINQLVKSHKPRFFQMPNAFRYLVYAANISDLQDRIPPPAVISERLDWVFGQSSAIGSSSTRLPLTLDGQFAYVSEPAVQLYVRAGNYARAADVACSAGVHGGYHARI